MWQPFIFNVLFAGIGVILNESKMKSRFRVITLQTLLLFLPKKNMKGLCVFVVIGGRRNKPLGMITSSGKLKIEKMARWQYAS